MGLDTYLYKQKQKSELEQVFDNLVGEKVEMAEVLYWRKNFNLLEWFRNNMCEIDNCGYHEVSKEIFEKLLEALDNGALEYEWDDDCEQINRDIDMITKILKEEDFKTTKFFFYNWW